MFCFVEKDCNQHAKHVGQLGLGTVLFLTTSTAWYTCCAHSVTMCQSLQGAYCDMSKGTARLCRKTRMMNYDATTHAMKLLTVCEECLIRQTGSEEHIACMWMIVGGIFESKDQAGVMA